MSERDNGVKKKKEKRKEATNAFSKRRRRRRREGSGVERSTWTGWIHTRPVKRPFY